MKLVLAMRGCAVDGGYQVACRIGWAILGMLLPQVCAANTPSQLVAEGKQRAYQSRDLPGRVAGCIARNLENSNSAFTANVREGATPGSFEVILRVPVMRSNANNAVFAIEPTSSGSSATMFIRPDISEATVDKVARDAFSGC